MTYDVQTMTAKPDLIAAVRARARIADIAHTWKPSLDQVWAFLKANPTLKPGHNLFLYHHGERREAPTDIDFGVQVPERFETQGNVQCVTTPTGTIAFTRHIGPYDRLSAAHDAIHAWCRENSPLDRRRVMGDLRRLARRPGQTRNDDQLSLVVKVAGAELRSLTTARKSRAFGLAASPVRACKSWRSRSTTSAKPLHGKTLMLEAAP